MVGGRPQWLRETVAFGSSGPALLGKRIVIDPGHGGPDRGVVGRAPYAEADLAFDLAARLEGRLAAAGMRVLPDPRAGVRPASSDRERVALANELGADLFISLHIDGHRNPAARRAWRRTTSATTSGVSSTVGERLAGLVQREIVARTGMRDCKIHGKVWDLLRLTRMPAVRVEVGYLTSPVDRARLVDPAVPGAGDRVASWPRCSGCTSRWTRMCRPGRST